MTPHPYNTTHARTRESDNLWRRHHASPVTFLGPPTSGRSSIDLIRPACALASKDPGKRRSALQGGQDRQQDSPGAFSCLSATWAAQTFRLTSGPPTSPQAVCSSHDLPRHQSCPSDDSETHCAATKCSAETICLTNRCSIERHLRARSLMTFNTLGRKDARGPGDRCSGETGIERYLHRVCRPSRPGGWAGGAAPVARRIIDLDRLTRGRFPARRGLQNFGRPFLRKSGGTFARTSGLLR
jgi:hypothetical protein